MRTTGKILITAAGFLCAAAAAGGVLLSAWRDFEPPQVEGSLVQIESNDLRAVTENWFQSYTASLEGWDVPYSWRIHRAEISGLELLDEPGYIQLDYTVQPASRNSEILRNLELSSWYGDYLGQTVLHWEQENGAWRLTEAIRPAAYQLLYPDPEEEQERQIAENTRHYLMDTDTPCTCFAENGILYVTYDGGETSVEVPDGYGLVCRNPNDSYSEYLPEGSYVVSEDFTGFIGYENGNAVLLFSRDGGQSWQTSPIGPGHKALSFLSWTEQGCYAAFAVDRSLGHDYYGAFYSDDLKTWQQISLPQELSSLTCAYWASGGRGYFADGDTGYVSSGSGDGWTPIEYSPPEELTAELGYNPFDSIDRFYEENGSLYMVVGQGDDGDYTRNGELIQALYCSEDGVHFTFEGTITVNPVEAG